MPASALRNCRILVVEDEFCIAWDVEMALQAEQAIVLGPVGKVQPALELVAQEPEISAAVLDVNVGGEMVYPVADALLERAVPFFFATGEPPDTIPPHLAGVDICPKPFDAAHLVRRIVALLAS